jgi:hypothetical protein
MGCSAKLNECIVFRLEGQRLIALFGFLLARLLFIREGYPPRGGTLAKFLCLCNLPKTLPLNIFI